VFGSVFGLRIVPLCRPPRCKMPQASPMRILFRKYTQGHATARQGRRRKMLSSPLLGRSVRTTKRGNRREFEKREQTGTFFHAGSFFLVEKRNNKKDRPFRSLPPRTSFHHAPLEGKGSFSPLRHRPGLCYDVGTGTPERKQRGRKKQWRCLGRPTVALECAEGHFCCRSLRRKHFDPFDISRDGKRRKKCGFRPFLWKYKHEARERAAQNQKKNAATTFLSVSTGIVTANGCVGTLQASRSFSKWLQEYVPWIRTVMLPNLPLLSRRALVD
jgi:hypothetical protein